MTPLAHLITKQLTLPVRERIEDAADSNVAGTDFRLYAQMADVHCFDLTEVRDMMCDLAYKLADSSQGIGPLGFLPAPKTWIEWDESSRCGRSGFLLEESIDGAYYRSAFAQNPSTWDSETFADLGVDRSSYRSWGWDEKTPLHSAGVAACGRAAGCFYPGDDVGEERMPGDTAQIYAALALINSPRMIGRRQHAPHRGLEKKLLGRRAVIGCFPLHAWTEIKLEVMPPVDGSSEGVHEDHLTGQRALHFCRSHLRIRLGRLEVVRAHWRGDAVLGIKQSRYMVAA